MQTTARISKEGKHFEVLVNLDEALKVRKDKGNLGSAVLTDGIFHNLKNGEKASDDDLEKYFGSADVMVVAEKIIKNGEVVLPVDYKQEEQEKKYKQVIDFLSKNAVSPQGVPYTPDKIMNGLKEANVQIKNKPIDSQMRDIIDKLSKILPLKIEMKKIKVTIPAQYTGRVYGIINEFKQSEEWMQNGDLIAVLNIPAGMIMDFYDKLNGVTHGAVVSEDIEKGKE